MRTYITLLASFLLFSAIYVSNGLAQSTTDNFCGRHANLWDNNGKLTLEGHNKLHLGGGDWWFNSDTNQWENMTNTKIHWSLEDYKDIYIDGPGWWVNSETKKWEEFPNAEAEELDCHKKLYLSGPQWWFDSAANEWKRWPNK